MFSILILSASATYRRKNRTALACTVLACINITIALHCMYLYVAISMHRMDVRSPNLHRI